MTHVIISKSLFFPACSTNRLRSRRLPCGHKAQRLTCRQVGHRLTQKRGGFVILRSSMFILIPRKKFRLLNYVTLKLPGFDRGTDLFRHHPQRFGTCCGGLQDRCWETQGQQRKFPTCWMFLKGPKGIFVASNLGALNLSPDFIITEKS